MVYPNVSSDFVAVMEDDPDLFEEPYDSMCPVVCSPKCVNHFHLNRVRRRVGANVNIGDAKAISRQLAFSSYDTRRKMARLYPRFSNWLTISSFLL